MKEILEVYASTDCHVIPAKVLEHSIFNKPYFVGRFLKALLSPRIVRIDDNNNNNSNKNSNSNNNNNTVVLAVRYKCCAWFNLNNDFFITILLILISCY